MSVSLPTQVESSHAVVALVGNPNTGKTTLFNALTGYRQRVGNYPGVTVEKKNGVMRQCGGAAKVELVDLPGAYSLAAGSADEAIVLDVLIGTGMHGAAPDAIVVVLDATNLARNFFFASQVMELGRPVVLALNMVDLAEASGMRVDTDALAERLGVQVIPVVATKGVGLDRLRRAICESIETGAPKSPLDFPDCVRTELEALRASLAGPEPGSNHVPTAVEALQTLLNPGGYHETRLVTQHGRALFEELAERRGRIVAAGESLAEVEARVRYAWIGGILESAVTRSRTLGEPRSEKADRILTHRLWGMAILLVLMCGCFQSIYAWAGPLMDAIDGGFAGLATWIGAALPAGALQSLIRDGVIAGAGAVLVFLPQIMILFLFIAVLEDCGYMARVAFLLDRWMGLIGLNGKSFIPLLSSFACAVPGIMSTRTIEDKRDRFLTILIAPLMSCSARLPVYILLIAAFVPNRPVLGGVVGLQALTLLAMYCVGTVVAVLVALVLKRTLLKGPRQSFLMELPAYKWPSAKTVLYRIYEQAKAFCVSAGTIIFAVAIVIWALGYYPHPASVASAHDAQRASASKAHTQRLEEISGELAGATAGVALQDEPQVAAALAALEGVENAFSDRVTDRDFAEGSEGRLAARREADEGIASIVAQFGPPGRTASALRQSSEALEQELSLIDKSESGAYLRQSILGRMGAWIEPVVRPLGWDWRIGMAAIAAFPAREVVIATMGTIYNLGDDQDETSEGLRAKLQSAAWPDGRKVYNLPVALSIMVFFALCCQCGATLATIKRETNSWRWPVFTFTYMTTLAYLAALVTYQTAIRFA